MKIFNSYTNKLEEFKPIHEKTVNMYVCGPTVYNYIHIGNARVVVFFDVVRRFFEYLGYKVNFVSNFTDVDDKIIKRAFEEGISEKEVADKYIKAFLKDAEALGSRTDYLKPQVTKYMDKIIKFTQDLIDSGASYLVDGDVYFDVSKIEKYGNLSNQNINDLISGARIDVNEKKKSPLDFTIWKKTESGINWEAPFSTGRPGWHTECVCMIDDIFHEKIDIHGGGTDLLFPHHENEIAQSEALHHHNIANFWMHSGRLNLEGEKMSKSIGNVIFVKDLPGDLLAYRLFLLQTSYHSPINFSYTTYEANVKEWEKMKSSYKALFLDLDINDGFDDVIETQEILEIKEEFVNNLSDDFNTPNAITMLQKLFKIINNMLRSKTEFGVKAYAYSTLNTFLDILGLSIKVNRLTDEERAIYKQWIEARKNKNFDEADKLRIKLTEKGIM